VLATLINGAAVKDATHALSIDERGLNYGDGVFETMRVQAGRVRLIDKHLVRLRAGCERLGIAAPTDAALLSDIATLIHDRLDGVLKLIVTRGAGGRGYRPLPNLNCTRVAILYPPIADEPNTGINVRWCTTRLGRNAQLAGIKHLNRLEQVLAQSEWTDPRIAEGLMLDTEGELICATSGNLFVVSDGILATPDLRFSGVRGVMRDEVIRLAIRENIAVEERPLRPDDLLNASEAFTTNALRGIRSVVALEAQSWPIGSIASRLDHSLATSAN